MATQHRAGRSLPRRGAARHHVRDGARAGSGRPRARPRSRRDPPRQPHRPRRPAVHVADPARRTTVRAIRCASRRSSAAIDYAGFRAEQARLRAEGRHVGIGFAVYNELTGLGPGGLGGAADALSHRPRRARPCAWIPSGAVTVLAGVTSQGQGLETTLAQIVAGELGVPIDDVRRRARRHRRHAVRPRCLRLAAGRDRRRRGAPRRRGRVRDKIARIAAHVLEAAVDDLDVADGRVSVRGAPDRAVSLVEVARVAHLETNRLAAPTSSRASRPRGSTIRSAARSPPARRPPIVRSTRRRG